MFATWGTHSDHPRALMARGGSCTWRTRHSKSRRRTRCARRPFRSRIEMRFPPTRLACPTASIPNPRENHPRLQVGGWYPQLRGVSPLATVGLGAGRETIVCPPTARFTTLRRGKRSCDPHTPYPIPHTQHPTPNTQHPTPNTPTQLASAVAAAHTVPTTIELFSTRRDGAPEVTLNP